MERLTSALFLCLIFCLYFPISESLIAKKFQGNGVLRQFNRQRRSVNVGAEKRRVVRELISDAVYCEPLKDVVNKKLNDTKLRDKFVREHELDGDSKTNLQLAWTGNDYEKVLILTSAGGSYSLYVSDDGLANVVNSTGLLDNAFKDKDIVVVKHPNDSKIVYVMGSMGSDFVMYVTLNGAANFQKAIVDNFIISGIVFHPENSKLVLATDDNKKELYLSKDSGINWMKIKSKVFDVKWSTYGNSQDIFALSGETTEYLGMRLNSGIGVLERSSDLGQNWKNVMSNVHSFGMEGKFLYCSKYTSEEKRDERNLMVSTDNGTSWNRARVPTITPERFYSIVDSSDDKIMLHVDNPGDTGHGTLYMSDESGIVFSESLRNHLYPNFEDITDFYKVLSMRGVYIASVIENDNSIRSMITYNGGAEWRPIERPGGVPCVDETKICSLNIHNQYSIRRGIPGSPPLSVPNAPGLILAHGYVSDSLQNVAPDVFVSSDGGYSWTKALDGPHHYQIADYGGFMVAVPADTDTPDVIKFSTDAGRCWITYKYTDAKDEKKVMFTGLLVEPGNRDMIVAIWGYTQEGRQWHTFVLNFTAVIDKKCGTEDYEPWVAKDHNKQDACILGAQEIIQRVKTASWCYNGRSFVEKKSESQCLCTKEDYYCDYGYRRDTTDDSCVRDDSITDADVNICLRGKEKKIVFVGYQKIPGDKCTGGYEPHATKTIDLNKQCTVDYVKSLKQPDQSLSSSSSKLVLVGLGIIGTAIVIIILTTYVARKYRVYRTKTTYRYSSIRCEDADDDAALEALRRNTSLYDNSSDDDDDDDDDERTNITSRPGGGDKTYKMGSSGGNGQIPNGRPPISSNGHSATPRGGQPTTFIPVKNQQGATLVQIGPEIPPTTAAAAATNKATASGLATNKITTAAPAAVAADTVFNKGPFDETDDELLH